MNRILTGISLRSGVMRQLAIATLCLLQSAPFAPAQEGQLLVIAGPFTGIYTPLGDLLKEQVPTQAESAQTILIDTRCDAQRAATASLEILALSPKTVVGIPCIDVFDVMAPVLIEADISIATVGLQTPDVTSDKAGLVRRVAPTLTQIHSRLAQHLSVAWRNVPFAIVDDGTLSGRLLAEQVGAALAGASLEPIFRDTYRPLLSNQSALVRRLSRAGVQHVLLGGDSFDASVIGADAQRLGLTLVIAGGPNLLGTIEDGQLPDGTLMAAAPPFDELAALAMASLGLSSQTPNLTFDANGEPVENLSILLEVRNGTPIKIAPTSQ